MLARIFLLSFCFVCTSVFAGDPEPASGADNDTAKESVATSKAAPAIAPVQTAEQRAQYSDQIAALNTEAAQRRVAADKQYALDKTACWKKFLVSSCLEDVRQTNRREIIEVQKLERESRILDREVKRYDAAQHAADLAAENARKDADNEARAAAYRAKQEEAAAKRAARNK